MILPRDMTEASDVQVQIRRDGKVLWVNVDGICALRVCRIDRLSIEDSRPDPTTPDEARGGSNDQHTNIDD